MAKTVYKFPKTLGAMADRYYELRNERLLKQKEVDALQAEQTALQDLIIDMLPKSQANGVSGKLANVSVVTKQAPRVADWDKLYAYIVKQKAFHLLQRRLSEGAIQELWDDKKTVPGVEAFQYAKLSVNKL